MIILFAPCVKPLIYLKVHSINLLIKRSRIVIVSTVNLKKRSNRFIKRVRNDMAHLRYMKALNEISLKRVQRLMKEAGIRSITVKKFRPTPSKEKVEERENILKRDFSTTTINQKWVGDITYIHTLRDGWCYLASVLDLHTKKVIGYSFSRSMTIELVEKALENACITQKPEDGVIFHSDLGSQYTSDSFAEKIKSYKMAHS